MTDTKPQGRRFSMPALLAQLPGPASAKWPDGERFMPAYAHGSMKLELYAPRGQDPQAPHAQDELYVVVQGSAALMVEGKTFACAAGDVLFVPAGAEHRFRDLSDDFATWVVFWGPEGGEA
jgi:mannose-6-phosphate isomerase-like protein (cupin superfamily)